jgi:hypothetical protein
MGKVYIGNAFSLQMLSSFNATVVISEVEAFPKDAISVVGHQDTANVLGVAFNRVSLKLEEGDVLYVAQVVGGRLPEGCTTLPEGFQMKFLKVEVRY